MVSKSQIKLIKSLSQKKFRMKHGLFVVEGIKSIQEFLQSDFIAEMLFTTQEGLFSEKNAVLVSENELGKMSQLKTAQKALAVFRIPEPEKWKLKGLVVALDDVSDPGNLGTIIRLCDWFGVEKIICSNDTVDCYNPKVVQASMGSLSRMKIEYLDLGKFLENLPEEYPVFGALLEGKNIYETVLPETGVLIMGNEAHGISENISGKISKPLTIPQFGNNQQTESLNVAMATAIFLSEFRRNLTIER